MQLFFSQAKGKGKMRTFFVDASRQANTSSAGSSSLDHHEGERSFSNIATTSGSALPPPKLRLVDWIVQLMVADIKKIVSRCN